MIGKLFIAIFGVLLAAILLMISALFGGTLVYFLWNYLAPTYFTFLPPLYHHIPWWNCVCMMWLLGLINPFRSNVNVEKK